MAEFDSGGEPVRKRHSEDYVAGGYCSFCLGHSHGASNCPNKPKPIATHDEVIAWIDERIENIDDFAAELFQEEVKASLLANRAVLERHNSTKTQYGKPMCDCCYAQNGDSSLRQPFPCPTYTDIADPIRSVM